MSNVGHAAGVREMAESIDLFHPFGEGIGSKDVAIRPAEPYPGEGIAKAERCRIYLVAEGKKWLPGTLLWSGSAGKEFTDMCRKGTWKLAAEEGMFGDELCGEGDPCCSLQHFLNLQRRKHQDRCRDLCRQGTLVNLKAYEKMMKRWEKEIVQIFRPLFKSGKLKFPGWEEDKYVGEKGIKVE